MEWLLENRIGLAGGATAVFALLSVAREPGSCCTEAGAPEPDEGK